MFFALHILIAGRTGNVGQAGLVDFPVENFCRQPDGGEQRAQLTAGIRIFHLPVYDEFAQSLDDFHECGPVTSEERRMASK